jgi:hypothetical protein
MNITGTFPTPPSGFSPITISSQFLALKARISPLMASACSHYNAFLASPRVHATLQGIAYYVERCGGKRVVLPVMVCAIATAVKLAYLCYYRGTQRWNIGNLSKDHIKEKLQKGVKPVECSQLVPFTPEYKRNMGLCYIEIVEIGSEVKHEPCFGNLVCREGVKVVFEDWLSDELATLLFSASFCVRHVEKSAEALFEKAFQGVITEIEVDAKRLNKKVKSIKVEPNYRDGLKKIYVEALKALSKELSAPPV